MEDRLELTNDLNPNRIRMQKLTPEILGLSDDGLGDLLKAQISYKARMNADGHKVQGSHGSQVKCRCPFHDDNTPSFFISKADDYGYCFGCPWKGDIIQYERDFHGVDYPTALKRLEEWRTTGANGNGRIALPEVVATPFTLNDDHKKEIQQASNLLAQDIARIERIAARKKWSTETILRLAREQDLGWWDGLLGFHYSTGIKLRDWPNRDFHWKVGKNGLWRDRLLDKASKIFLSEGESDAISLIDCGIEEEPGVAVLGVPGAKGFKHAWGDRFTGKNVIIWFDNDKEGFDGTQTIHRILAPFAADVKSYSWKGTN